MGKTLIDLSGLVLDDFGRVVLPDQLLTEIDKCDQVLAAGAQANGTCPDTANTGCTNLWCNGSSNVSCSNYFSCASALNTSCFVSPNEVPED